MNPRKRSAEREPKLGIETSRLINAIEKLKDECVLVEKDTKALKDQNNYLDKKNRQIYAINNELERKIFFLKNENKELYAIHQDDKKKIIDLQAQIEALQNQISSFQQVNFPQQQALLRDQNALFGNYYNQSLLNLDNKEVLKILSSLPKITTSNPIAALINFSKHHIRKEVDFKNCEITIDGYSRQMSSVFLGDTLLCRGIDSKLKDAKKAAATWALVRLNEDKKILENLIIRLNYNGRYYANPNINVDELISKPFDVNGQDHTVSMESVNNYKLSLQPRNANFLNDLAQEQSVFSNDYQVIKQYEHTIVPVKSEPILTELFQNSRKDQDESLRPSALMSKAVYLQEDPLTPKKNQLGDRNVSVKAVYPQDGFWSRDKKESEEDVSLKREPKRQRIT